MSSFCFLNHLRFFPKIGVRFVSILPLFAELLSYFACLLTYFTIQWFLFSAVFYRILLWLEFYFLLLPNLLDSSSWPSDKYHLICPRTSLWMHAFRRFRSAIWSSHWRVLLTSCRDLWQSSWGWNWPFQSVRFQCAFEQTGCAINSVHLREGLCLLLVLQFCNWGRIWISPALDFFFFLPR